MTLITWAQDKLLTMGDLYYATDVVDFTSFAKLTSANLASVATTLAAYTYVTVWHINNFNRTHSMTNEEIIRAGNCGVGELGTLAQKTPTINFTWLDVNNRAAFAKLLGSNTVTVAWPPAEVLTGYTITKEMIPFQVFKFVSCVNPISDTQGVQDTIYCVKFKLSSDLVEQYVDLTQEGSTFAWVECSFTGATEWLTIKSTETVTL